MRVLAYRAHGLYYYQIMEHNSSSCPICTRTPRCSRLNFVIEPFHHTDQPCIWSLIATIVIHISYALHARNPHFTALTNLGYDVQSQLFSSVLAMHFMLPTHLKIIPPHALRSLSWTFRKPRAIIIFQYVCTFCPLLSAIERLYSSEQCYRLTCFCTFFPSRASIFSFCFSPTESISIISSSNSLIVLFPSETWI